MTFGDRTIDAESVAGEFDLQGERLDIRELTASRPGTALRANGSITFRDSATTVDVTVSGSSEIESWLANLSDEAGVVGTPGGDRSRDGSRVRANDFLRDQRPIDRVVQRSGQHNPGNRRLRRRPAVAECVHAGRCRRDRRRSRDDCRRRHPPSESHRGAVGRYRRKSDSRGRRACGNALEKRHGDRRMAKLKGRRHRRGSTSARPPASSRQARRP